MSNITKEPDVCPHGVPYHTECDSCWAAHRERCDRTSNPRLWHEVEVGKLRAALERCRAIIALDSIEYDDVRSMEAVIREALAGSHDSERQQCIDQSSQVETGASTVYQCSNPSCGQIWAADPHGHCPACFQPNGTGWSTVHVVPRTLPAKCGWCHGSGEDGDAPDANGEGGWRGKCEKCNGTGLAQETGG